MMAQPDQGANLLFRPRRLRTSAALRRLVQEHRPRRAQLIYPLFVTEEGESPQPVASMPGIYRWPLDHLAAEVERVQAAGLGGVLLFGVPRAKDSRGSGADDPRGIVQQAVALIKSRWPDLLVMTDVCLCAYTDHGHCGLLTAAGVEAGAQGGQAGFQVDNDTTLPQLASMAVSHARAGADVVAPSAMMDGQVAALRQALDTAGFIHTAVMGYSVKYASAYYGPFREAAASAPGRGDRRTYQMDAANLREALLETALDEAEGADIVMVKPALAYLDVIRAVSRQATVPLAAYNVSGEYSLVKAAAQAGWIDEKQIVLENLTAFVRAGADIIITYHALAAAPWLAEL